MVEADVPLPFGGEEGLPEGPPVPAPIPVPPEDDPIAELRASDSITTALISGEAGTGKTFAVTKWSEEDGGVELCATTGIAAINLGGATINSILGYFDTDSLRDAYVSGHVSRRMRKLQQAGRRWLVIDEMSMLDGDQLDILTSALDDQNGHYSEDGLLGICLVGDFAQLPPVGVDNKPPRAKFAFQAGVWGRYADHRVKLTTIRRQADLTFIRALQAVRSVRITDAVIDVFRPQFHVAVDHEYDGTTLVAKNDEVDRINSLRYIRLAGPEGTYQTHRFVAIPDGSEHAHAYKPRSEWKQIPDTVKVKPGALVMLLANKGVYEDSEFQYFQYINGDLGHVVEDFDPKDSMNTSRVPVRLVRDNSVVYVGYVTREIYHPEDLHKRKRENKRVVASVTYMPLRLAYASTVHKAQGLSFDRVQISLRDRFWASPHMLYVALSRCRTIEGMTLVGDPMDIRRKAVLSPRILPFL